MYIFFFTLSAVMAISFLYFARELLRLEIPHKRLKITREKHKIQTLIEIESTCKHLKTFKNENNTKEIEKAARWLEENAKFIKEYY